MEEDEDICRVCRSGATADKPLFHPCICTGSIRYVHQECLVEWISHSNKESCELCNHKYTFQPIYSPDMPNRLPLQELMHMLTKSVRSVIKCWLLYTIVTVVWLGIVPLTVARVYKFIFAGSISALISLQINFFSPHNILSDLMIGYALLACSFACGLCLLFFPVHIFNEELPPLLVFRQRRNRENHQNINDNHQENDLENEAQNMQLGNENQVDNNNNQNDQVENVDPVPVPDEVDDGHIDWNAFDGEVADERQVHLELWERAFGLDNILKFIERVFWVLALNILFILIFAFFPYHIGHFLVHIFDLNTYIEATQFESFLITLLGYVLTAGIFLFVHVIMQLSKLEWPGWIFGLGYIILKVCLLAVIELGIFPLVSGIWLDICSLKAFNSTLQFRQESYMKSPALVLFTHWIAGMIFVFYFTLFLMLLREILRPGVLWFLRNLNDPNFNPINEMIQLSMLQHIRRFLLSSVIFGFTIVVIVWCPVQLIAYTVPKFLPYCTEMYVDIPVTELPWQMLSVQVLITGFLEFTNTKGVVKFIVRLWASGFSTLLGLRSYLLGDNGIVLPFDIAEQNVNIRNEWAMHQPFVKPSHFAARIVALFVCLVLTLITASISLLALPVFIGRTAVAFAFSYISLSVLVPDVYNFIFGFYIIIGSFRFYRIVTTWVPRGWHRIKMKLYDNLNIFFKFCILTFVVFFVISILLGVLFDFIVLIPLRTSLNQSPVILLWQDWILGIFLVKAVLGLLLIGPSFWLKDDIERVYQQGIRQLPVFRFVKNTLMPVVIGLLASLCIPYFVGHFIRNLWSFSMATENFLKWRSHFFLMVTCACIGFVQYEWKQFCQYCDHIKNERYLIGRQLKDYVPTSTEI